MTCATSLFKTQRLFKSLEYVILLKFYIEKLMFQPTTKHSSMTIIFSRCLVFFLLLCSLSVRGLQPHSSILSRLKSVETFARYTALK